MTKKILLVVLVAVLLSPVIYVYHLTHPPVTKGYFVLLRDKKTNDYYCEAWPLQGDATPFHVPIIAPENNPYSYAYVQARETPNKYLEILDSSKFKLKYHSQGNDWKIIGVLPYQKIFLKVIDSKIYVRNDAEKGWFQTSSMSSYTVISGKPSFD